MKIGIPNDVRDSETRVAATPDTVSKLVKAGHEVHVMTGAGSGAHISDDAYTQAGATIVKDMAQFGPALDVLFKVRPLQASNAQDQQLLKSLKPNTIIIAPFYAARDPALITLLKDKRLTAFALELVPRIARAQSMDILSSMSNLAGYKSVVLAADYLPKVFPMMTTAAGTLQPAKVIVIGAGVAGLQAIATARRLGGVVIAFDTRPAAGEQVKSLGADFVTLESSAEAAQDAGGYAKEQSADFYQHEQATIQRYAKEADVIITTALIPGRRAPLLITKQMVNDMRAGSVIVDLAAEQQGNCELTEPGKIIQHQGVTIIGLLNLASTLAVNASQLIAKNLYAFFDYIAPQIAAKQWDKEDDIVKNTLLLQQGEVMHPSLRT